MSPVDRLHMISCETYNAVIKKGKTCDQFFGVDFKDLSTSINFYNKLPN